MIKIHFVPPIFSTSFVIPFPKSRQGPFDDPSKYRGISIAPTITKIFENVLLTNFMHPFQSQIHDLQGGLREGLGTGHTSFLLHEALIQSNTYHSKCYVALLDARKAFDTVWHEGLFVKIFKTSVTSDYGCLLFNGI